MSGDAVAGSDGLLRCPWGTSTPDYVRYHDEEWGRPVRDDRGLYERLSLEAFQSGLSWLTILRKRPAFRQAFADFDPVKVAEYRQSEIDHLLQDAGIVRNRRKIEATIANARATLAIPGGLAALAWSYAEASPPVRASLTEIPATTPASTALAKDLKRRGFRHVGPTTVYALMQACGLVNDHLADCFAHADVTAARALG